MFDNTCKFLAENFSQDFASWLLGRSIPLTQLSPSELSNEPIRADALILLQSDNEILHLEFQTQPDPTIAYRMADYRLRVYRRFLDKTMRQVVIYLKPSSSELVYQTSFDIPNTYHQFEVIRLWEEPTSSFLNAPGLLPFAVLSRTSDPQETLRQVAVKVNDIAEKTIQSNIAATTAILAGLSLKPEFIHQVLRRDIMQQSVIYQEWRKEFLEEGLQAGRQEGLQAGRQEGERSLILRLLTRRFGPLTPEIASKVTGLSTVSLESLGEALLGFEVLGDLEQWLQPYSAND